MIKLLSLSTTNLTDFWFITAPLFRSAQLAAKVIDSSPFPSSSALSAGWMKSLINFVFKTSFPILAKCIIKKEGNITREGQEEGDAGKGKKLNSDSLIKILWKSVKGRGGGIL